MTTTKRKNYGVTVNQLGTNVSKQHATRVADVLQQATSRGFQSLTTAVQLEVESSIQFIAQYGLKPGMKMPTETGKRFHILCTAKAVLFMAYTYSSIDSDVRVCLQHGTPTNIYSPYKVPDMIQVTSLGEWNELLSIETAKNKLYYATLEYAQWEAETQIRLTAVLNTPTPWLGDGFRLHTFMKKFNNLAEFLDYAQGTIAALEELGEWDLELTSSLVMNEKASTAHMVDKTGRRTFWCKDDPDAVAYWYNYEVLPADICTKFLHLTYLNHIGYKPLKKVMTNGATFGGKEIWMGTALEDMVRTTPLYFDPNQKHDKVEEDITLSQDEIQWMQIMGYEKAKAYLNGELDMEVSHN